MYSPEVYFDGALTKSDPRTSPVLIVGQIKHLTALKFSDVSLKLEPRVVEESWQIAVKSLQPSPTDSCSLYLNLATVAGLPLSCSRHNTPSRGHALSKIVKAHSVGADEFIVLVCEKPDLLASVCAVARAYPLFTRKTASNLHSSFKVTIQVLLADGESLSQEDNQVLNHVIYGTRLTASIVDTPANEMHTDAFIEAIENIGEKLAIKPYIIRGEDLQKKGFGGIYGVGKAAVHPPALAVLSYTPEGATEDIAWVGKGIVYDTGGLSMKTKTGMPGMKRDCGGAAGILGAFYATVKSGFSENLHAVFCLAENAVASNATKPDDIHTLYSGRTVEINNTDAEGRLVLSDGCYFAHHDLQCKTILDMATLTGAQATATGKYHAAVLTNNESWENAIFQAGRVSGDLVHPLPYTPELHFCEFASAVADMKNSVADRHNATSSCAGLFINAHLGFDYSGTWIHVDMAAPVDSGERATGYGVALLSTLFGSSSHSSLLKSISPSVKYNQVAENGAPSKKMRVS